MPPRPDQLPPFQDRRPGIVHVFEAMGGKNEVELLMDVLRDDIGIAMLSFKGPHAGKDRIFPASDVDAVPLQNIEFSFSPEFSRFGSLVHKCWISVKIRISAKK
jgi:hypothetical protein